MDNNQNMGGMQPPLQMQQQQVQQARAQQPQMQQLQMQHQQDAQRMKQANEQRKAAQMQYNADFFGKMCIPTLVYALIYTFCLYANAGGILVTVFALATVVYALYCHKAMGIKVKPMTIWYSAMIILTALSSGLTDNIVIHTFNILWMFIFLVFMLLHNFCNDKNWGLMKYIAAACQAVFGGLACIYEPFVDISDYTRSSSKRGKNRILYVLIGVAIALPLLIIVTVLLCRADMVFAAVIKKLFADINFFTLSAIVLLFFFALFSAYCGIKYLCKRNISDDNFKSPDFPAAIAITISAVISVVYVFFCVIQIVYLFGRRAGLPSGYTYAQYAREGFFQLLFVCIFNVVLVLLGSGLFKKNKLLNVFLILITLCTYIMVASSAYRMGLYVGEYGLTTTRFCVFWALGVIALFMLGVILSICSSRFGLFHYGIVVIGVCYVALAFAKPDYWVARYNTTQMDETDYEYLVALSTDASPALATDADFIDNDALVSMYARKLAIETNDSLRQYNLSHAHVVALFRDKITEAKKSQYVLLTVYTSNRYNSDKTGLEGVDRIQLGYRILNDSDGKRDSSAFYDSDSDAIDSYGKAEPAQFAWTEALEIKNFSDDRRVFLAKIPRDELKDKDGFNVEYSFTKNGETMYSDELNVLLDRTGISELALSYDENAADYNSTEYQIYMD
ncbi:DUF4153 domain-containing protein [Agathobacter sp.]